MNQRISIFTMVVLGLVWVASVWWLYLTMVSVQLSDRTHTLALQAQSLSFIISQVVEQNGEDDLEEITRSAITWSNLFKEDDEDAVVFLPGNTVAYPLNVSAKTYPAVCENRSTLNNPSVMVPVPNSNWCIMYSQLNVPLFSLIEAAMIASIVSVLLLWYVFIRIANKQISFHRQMEELKDNVVHGIAHDIRSPLSVIRGYAELLSSKGDSFAPAKRKHYLETIERSSTNLITMVSDLLDIRKLENKQFNFEISEFDINEIVKQQLDYYSEQAQNQSLSLVHQNHSGGPLPIMADRKSVERIVANLLSNSIKFTPAQGVITVAAAVWDVDPDMIVCAVSDTGAGIPFEKQPLIFQKFFQAIKPINTDRPSSGLGLVICKDLIEGMGGLIWFRSEPGIGTTFYFTLPKAKPPVSDTKNSVTV